METPLELATNEQLIHELFSRATFFGVLVSVEVEVKGVKPKLGAPVAVRKTEQLSELGAAIVLNRAAGEILKGLAK